MTALWQSLGQLALGFALTGIPFAVGALWQAGRANDWRARAEHFEDKYEDLLDVLAPGLRQPPFPPPPAEPAPHVPLRIVRGGA